MNGNQEIAVEWTLILLTLTLVAARIFLRVHIKSSWINWSDVFVILAWLSFVVEASLDTCLAKWGLYEPEVIPVGAHLNVPSAVSPANIVRVLKVQWAEIPFYHLSFIFVKAALIIFYYKLVPKVLKRTRIALHITAALLVAYFLASIFCNLLWCWPVRRNWEYKSDDFCISWTNPAAASFSVGLHFITDILVFTLPLTILPHLGLSMRQKVGVGIMFAIGFLCIGCLVARILVFEVGHVESAISNVVAELETAWAITVVCAPAIKSVVSESWTKIGSHKAYASETGSSESSKNSSNRNANIV